MLKDPLETRNQRWRQFFNLESPGRVACLIRCSPERMPRLLPFPDRIAPPVGWMKEIPAHAHGAFDSSAETRDDVWLISHQKERFNA